ncbi:TonB-dependent receptor [Bowmanella sp. JS7-9]|uniref:TonB-dependent receptor n=1 Tax=Pseudobowmanella zhangzhouensis TaxID=1537679 RepID=A0ABW1XFW9_9ALTE|nr:TonB-dependent receptor [Bowmanella sp. JS7-9]TBX21049.1 TonB-dependent receptor [Bowmanella sp. JS7-9]
MKTLNKAALALCVQAALFSNYTNAQDSASAEPKNALEQITVTAQKRTQSIQEVPISIATLHGDRFDAIFSGGDDILALATRVPGLYAESSNGRVAPRFYMRGLGNTDFDLAASQPVSIVMDDVVMENVVLKSFPLFDVERVEVIRGPQGTLFGRNTTAGIVKFDTVKPSEDLEGYAKVGLGNYGTRNIEGAVGAGLTDGLSARISVLSQNRDDYIDNAYTDQNDIMGGFEEQAYRVQVLWEPSDEFKALLNVHGRDLDGTASMFRANILTTGSNKLNDNYVVDKVWYNGDIDGNGADNNPQAYKSNGISLKLEYEMDGMTLTSITANEKADGRSLGDIDGGVALFAPEDIDHDGDVETTYPGFIPFDAVTEDQLHDLKQFTQEIRLASANNQDVTWQVGAFYYDSSFSVVSVDGFFGASEVFHENTTWAVFGQSSYQIDENLNITTGVRYTHDEKSLHVGDQNVNGFALVIGAASVQDYEDINVSDGRWSYEVSANYKLDRNSSLFARYANGFRAQTIQGRDVAFEGAPSVADAETINSFEVGMKSDLLDKTLRLNTAVFYYQIDDIQLSAIGGDGNNTSLINADKGVGYGFEVDAEWAATDNLTLTAGFSLNKTELQDSNLAVAPCGSGQCTPLDQLNDKGQALVDGNPFPNAPETTLSVTARYAIPVGNDGEFYVYTDWAVQGKTNVFLYESAEYRSSGNFEGGLRIGYENFERDYSVALFGRNITNEHNLKGGIDFNNNTGIVNEPRIWGIEGEIRF